MAGARQAQELDEHRRHQERDQEVHDCRMQVVNTINWLH